ncbi:hypothetical protein [Arsenophonus endosymbiont of Bemisia tabaci]|uniref:hypothetical protein n=1 Tax=Arsenophonus endosymbiont of Bemisia tabaci TaxID=536059 RepID=UPI0015F463E3|nr:hypothetical protein [Arsenophonus endosymbiont of Bemisia tabaci]
MVGIRTGELKKNKCYRHFISNAVSSLFDINVNTMFLCMGSKSLSQYLKTV